VGRILIGLFTTYTNILTPDRSTKSYDLTSPLSERSPTTLLQSNSILIFGTKFSPDKFSAQDNIDQWAVTLSLKDGCF